MAILTAAHLASFFGILGNILSFLVFLAPVPTFYKIYKKKSTEGFQSLPYSVALFSALLLLYYGFLKTNGLMIITINGIGCAIESFYLFLFMIYATKEAKIYTTKLLLLFNVGAFGIMLLSTSLIFKGHRRLSIVGWICAVFSVCVFAAPLSIMRRVIKTKSVEYMPFPLSFCLTLSAIMWFFYGFLMKDFYIATPNILGFVFGIAQMVLYIIYKGSKKEAVPEAKLQDLTTVIDLQVVEMQENVKPEGMTP
ncbi:bidirectional sugar transporter SWEET9-like [Diospyros lotus]|uniref:bidirectional sugar transporter SWEET9-like n=1 Tax=Diospyros lotus TaxID=55363 RepID=UPI00224FA1AC|nr:bidirectional sugar transporter SWEET9-like [Diospyros lotus]